MPHGNTATFSQRHSRGRSIGEFVFGGIALHMELFDGGGIVGVVKQNVTRALFVTLNAMEIPGLMAPGAGILASLLMAAPTRPAGYTFCGG